MKAYVPTTKAYHNSDFLNSSCARSIRVLCEYEEGMHRLREHGINSTILVFGSARAKQRSEFDAVLASHIQRRDEEVAAGRLDAAANLDKSIARVQGTEWMCVYFNSYDVHRCAVYENICSLSKRLTEWSMDAHYANSDDPMSVGVSRSTVSSHSNQSNLPLPPSSSSEQNIVMCTGGGPGFMEAANKGARLVDGAQSIGFGISLPFEKGVNEYVSPELAFEFHYFFMRKFLMTYFCQALIVAPGGLGTMDELFELLTLRQTGKIQSTMPIVLFGKHFWENAVNWNMMTSLCLISPSDLTNMLFTDSVDEASEFIIAKLIENGVIIRRREKPAALDGLESHEDTKSPNSG